MRSIRDLMQDVVNLEMEERINVGRKAVSDIVKVLENRGVKNTDEQLSFLFNLIKLFVSADRNCSNDELKLINGILSTNISYDDFYDLTNNGSNPEFVENFNDLIDVLTEDEKTSIILFGLCIIAADDEITASEQKLFMRILN